MTGLLTALVVRSRIVLPNPSSLPHKITGLKKDRDTEHSGDGCEKTIARYLFDVDYGWDFVRRHHPEDDSACRTANVANPDVRSSGTLQIAKDLDGAPHL